MSTGDVRKVEATFESQPHDLSGANERRLEKVNIASLVLGLVAFVLVVCLVGSAAASFALSRTDGLLVISSRPKALDARYVLASSQRTKTVYMRSNSDFGQKLLAYYNADPKSDIHYFSVKNTVAELHLTNSQGRARFNSLAFLEMFGSKFPYSVLLLLVGVGVGFLWPFKQSYHLGTTVGLVILSALKYATNCPTCPTVKLLGVDAAIWGIVFFSAACLCTLTNQKALTAVLIGTTVLWQASAWYIYGQSCLPCQVIGVFSAILPASLPLVDYKQTSLERGQISFLAVAVCMSSMFSLIYWKTSIHPSKMERRDLSAFGFARKIPLRSVEQLGLTGTGKTRIIFIASSGCKPCHEMMEYSKSMMKEWDLYSADEVLPNSEHTWTVLPPNDYPLETPLLVRVDKKGRIIDQVSGFSNDSKWLSRLETFSMQEK